MAEQLTVLLVTALAHLVLGAWVTLRDPVSRVHRAFGFLSLTLAAWTASNALLSNYAGTQLGTVAARAAFAAASLIPSAFLLFASYFPSTDSLPPRRAARAIHLLALAFVLTSPTPLLVQATAHREDILQVTHGPLHPFFAAYFLASLVYSLRLLVSKLRTARGIHRLQLAYVLLGISLTATGGTVTNLLIPLIFRSSRLSPYGPVFSLVMIIMTAHAIIRYRLLNLRLVIRRSVTSGLTLVVLAISLALGSWGLHLANLDTPSLATPSHLVLILLLAMLFQPVKALLQRSLDRYFFRDPYDYDAVVREISRRVSTTLDTQSLLAHAQQIVHKTLRPDLFAAYLADTPFEIYRPALVTRNLLPEDPRQLPTISEHSLPPTALSPVAVLADAPQPSPSGEPRVPASLLARVGAHLFLPISSAGRLDGFLLLGAKLSGDPYFERDLDLLTTLTGQLAAGLGNARLYSQVAVAHEYLENILATMDSAVVAASTDFTVTLFNPAAERLTGLKAVDVKGQPVSILPSSMAASLSATLLEGTPRTLEELTIPDASGRLTPVICSTAPLRHRDGNLLGVVAVFSDLTRLKQLEAAKQRADQLASLGAIAAGIAHEIKNPLVAIRTFAELLPERFADDDFRTDFSRVVVHEIDRIDDLITRLRRLAPPDAHQLQPVDLCRPYEETLALLRGQLEQACVTVTTSYPDVPPIVLGDHGQLKQLFLNLMLNALDAISSRGEISVKFFVNRRTDSGEVIIQIKDTGCGVPPHLLDRVFDPFVTTKPRGSGLGLSICRAIAETHRASIRLLNNVDEPGATVVVAFPLAGDEISWQQP